MSTSDRAGRYDWRPIFFVRTLPAVSHDEDRALVAAILGGDRAALSRLVAREHAWLVRLARAVVRDAAVADEVVQDGWVAVIRALGTFEGR